MIHGSMQDYPLTLDKFLDHAARWHGEAEVVTAREDGGIARIGYAALRERSLAISSLLAGFGVSEGDRVATLAWNSQAHVEAWYATMGIGAVCHTLNPRLTAPQLAAMAVQSGAKLLIVSADLLPLARSIVERAPAIGQVLVIDGPAGDWPA
ncbi:MAG TPA: AMP-binding protein, partial [Sphingopyxis sp.]|uniref:AMP-binding protein n=1 Tax=Sphingopyxis sp. TaxID=1908224 RepID=UPI002BCBA25D